MTLLILKTANKFIELLPFLKVAAAEARIPHQKPPDSVRQKEDRLQEAAKEGKEAEPTQEGAHGLCHIANGGSCVAKDTVC